MKFLKIKLALAGLLLTSVSSGLCFGACGREDVLSYVSLKVGPSYHMKHGFDSGSNVDTYRYKVGGNIGVAIGFDFVDWLVELEYSYRRNKMKSVRDSGTGLTLSAKGYTSDMAAMLNVIYKVYMVDKLSLYMGLGGGFCNTRFKNDVVAGSPKINSDASEVVAAGQAKVGFGYELIEETLELTLGYKFFATQKIKSPNMASTVKNVPYSHSAEVGLTYKF